MTKWLPEREVFLMPLQAWYVDLWDKTNLQATLGT
jgi:hypothetical protein